MSVKHINRYYQQICDQYSQMVAELKDFEKEAEEGLFPPEKIDQIKISIEPLKVNYERWSYMMYLLNLPNKPAKKKKYERQFAKNKIAQISTDINNENLKSIENLKALK